MLRRKCEEVALQNGAFVAGRVDPLFANSKTRYILAGKWPITPCFRAEVQAYSSSLEIIPGGGQDLPSPRLRRVRIRHKRIISLSQVPSLRSGTLTPPRFVQGTFEGTMELVRELCQASATLAKTFPAEDRQARIQHPGTQHSVCANSDEPPCVVAQCPFRTPCAAFLTAAPPRSLPLSRSRARSGPSSQSAARR